MLNVDFLHNHMDNIAFSLKYSSFPLPELASLLKCIVHHCLINGQFDVWSVFRHITYVSDLNALHQNVNTGYVFLFC